MNPATDISLDLTEIQRLAQQLPTRALDQARRKSRSALNALAGVANQEAWSNRQDTLAEQLEALWWRRGWCDYPQPKPERSTTPLQILCWWTETIRIYYRLERLQNPLERTYDTEVSVIRWKLDALMRDLDDDQIHRLAHDIGTVRRRLEDILLDGLRDEFSPDVHCLADGCGAKLCRRMLDEGKGKKARRGLADEWSCPRCDRRYDQAAYNLALAEAGREAAEALVSEAARHAMAMDREAVLE